MQPYQMRSKISHQVLSFLSWIGSPADRHGRVSEFFRGVFILTIACFVGWLTHLAGYYGESGTRDAAFVYGGLAALLILGFFISSDTMMGANGLFCVFWGIYSLATGDWIISEWLSITGALCSTLFGTFLIMLWLP